MMKFDLGWLYLVGMVLVLEDKITDDAYILIFDNSGTIYSVVNQI